MLWKIIRSQITSVIFTIHYLICYKCEKTIYQCIWHLPPSKVQNCIWTYNRTFDLAYIISFFRQRTTAIIFLEHYLRMLIDLLEAPLNFHVTWCSVTSCASCQLSYFWNKRILIDWLTSVVQSNCSERLAEDPYFVYTWLCVEKVFERTGLLLDWCFYVWFCFLFLCVYM